MFDILPTHRSAPTRRPHAQRRSRRPSLEGLEDRLLLASPDRSPIVSFQVVNDWGSGFQAGVDFVSSQNVAIKDWSLEFDFARSIDSIWNASIVSHVGNHYVIKNGGWNANLAAGAHGTFGFTASPGNLTTSPSNYVLTWSSTTPPSLTIGDVSLAEGNSGITSASFTVSLSTAASGPVTVNYATADGTAKAGSDYQARSGTLTFAAGETKKTITVPILGDTSPEPDETFFVNLSAASGASIADGQGVGTIVNDDASGPALPTLSIDDVTTTEGDNGSTPAVFTVGLSAASTSTVTVAYAASGDTAAPGKDFTSVSGTLTFAPGETKKSITVPVLGDTLQEAAERYLVTLSAPAGATIARAVGQGTILDNDTPPPTLFNYGEGLQKDLFFYEAARSGDLPDDYPVDWRGDSAMKDGADVGHDLTGGYYDAGDHVKFGLPMAYSMSMLAWGVVQYRDAYAQSGQLATILDAIKWGTDYIIKAHTAPNEFWGQVGQGDLDHAAWVAPEVMAMARPAFKIDAQHPGSDLAGEAAAALASAAIAFKATDPAYSALLIQHAQQLFSFADTYRGKYSDSIADAKNYYTSNSYLDDLAWGALWLYKATGTQSYLDKARSIYDQAYAGQTMTWTQSWDDVRYGDVVLLAQLTGNAQYKTDAERWLDYWTVGTNGGATRIATTPGGLAFLNGWGSLRYSSTTAFLAFIYSDTVRDYSGRYHDFAVRQINYILGDNPQHFSYMVGFGISYPKNEHHRGASGVWDGNVANPMPNRHILYGALVGGPESASDSDYRDVRTDFVGNEVALDYNAGFTGALARMFLQYGGAPLAQFPIPDVRDPEFFVQADINNQGPTFTEIDALLNNRSAWPARVSTGLSFRYFVNLSEVYAAGYSSSDVQVQSYYSQGATLSPLLPWDAANRIYYVDVSFAGVPIGPGAGLFSKEAQLRIGLRAGLPASAWNPNNDWSYQGLVSGPNKQAITVFIPVYETGRGLLSGHVPGTSNPGTPTLSIDDVSITEGNTGSKLATFTVRLSQPAAGAVTVAYATSDGTAKSGSDYTATNGTLTFAPGTTVQTFTVPILGDTLAEGNETFRVTLSGAVNAVLGIGTATATILDDDAPPSGTPVAFNVQDNWGTGFVASVTIQNNRASAIDGWVLEFDLAADLTSIWNAEIVSHVGNHYVIRNAAWNRTIAAGAAVSFGFQGVPLATQLSLKNVLLNGVPV